MIPSVSDGEGAVLLDDVEDGASDGLRQLRRRRGIDGLHLRLWLLGHPSNRRSEHVTAPLGLYVSNPTGDEEAKQRKNGGG